MTTLTQRILFGFCVVILIVLGVATLLVSKTHQVQLQKQYGMLLEAIDNVSVQLDRLDSGYEGITTQTNLAKNRLARLIRIHRENLLVCAIFAQSRKKSSFDKRKSNGNISP